jgi:adenylate cyclase
VVDGSGKPIIHSDPEMMARSMSRKDEAGLMSDPLVLAAQRQAQTGDQGSFVDVGGGTYLVAVMPLAAGVLQGHRIAVAAPLDELMADANRGLLQGLAISAFVLTLAILGALFLARWISNSLHLLTISANRLQDLDFSTPIEVRSRVEEISMLGGAMSRAHDAIYTFALYVPKEFVRSVVEAGHVAGGSARRQEVTALFTDIFDFTTISEKYPPEDVVTMLSTYFDIFTQAVGEHNGTIIQFLGDSVFAMWNAPIADADHAEHACRYALAVEAKLSAFNEEQRRRGLPEFRTRYGIHSGAAVVGSVGGKERLQYTAMGDTINVASRLEGMNKLYGTSILASRAVVERCAGKFNFRPLGEGQAKGRSEKLDLFEVLALDGQSKAQSEPPP